MDKQDKESWCQYAQRKNYYRESQWDGRWIRMNKKEILEYEEALQQREEFLLTVAIPEIPCEGP